MLRPTRYLRGTQLLSATVPARASSIRATALSGGQGWSDNDRLEEERRAIRGTSTGAMRSRLSAVGVECQNILDESVLVDMLAERLVQARSQVVQFKLQRNTRGANWRKSHLVVPVDVEGHGFTDFWIDTGTSSTLITSTLRTELGVSPMEGNFLTGLDSSGLTVRQRVRLPTLRLGSRELDLKNAIVTGDLSDSVGGVLGLSFLRQVEVDMSRMNGTVAFHPVGHVEQGVLDITGLSRVNLSAVKGGLMITYVSLNGSSSIPAIVDLSANFSTISTAAALNAGISLEANGAGQSEGPSVGMRTVYLDPDRVVITLGMPEPAGLAGGSKLGSGLMGSLDQVTCSSQPVAVRDMPNLAPLGFKDCPVMILGTDVLCKRRTVLAFGSNALYLS